MFSGTDALQKGKFSEFWSLSFIIYILKPKSWLIDWGVASSSIVMSASYDTQREKKLSHFDIKSLVTGGTKIRPGKVGNWRIFESNWLNI